MNSKAKAQIESLPAALYPEQQLTGKVLEAAFEVHNTLGTGFLEKVYENALTIELRGRSLYCEQQRALPVRYRGTVEGDYAADIVVEGRVVLELKAISALDATHEAQVLNYLKASGLKVGLLLNFGRPKLQYRRFVS